VPAAHAAGTGGLVVYVNGVEVPGATATLEGTTPDVGSATYTEVFPDHTSPVHVFNAWSIQALIGAAGASPQSTAQVTVDRAIGGGAVSLKPPDYTDPIDFPEGPAVVWEQDPGQFFFFRPYRLPPYQDPNWQDYVQTPIGQDLTIHITAGAKLRVSIARSVRHPAAGQRVSFQATIANPVPGETLSYAWSFADGFTSKAGPTITHAFAKAGTYSGTVTVTGNEGSGGSAVTHVVVGSAPGSPGPGNNHPGGGSQSGGANGTHGGPTGNGAATGATGAGTKATPSHPPASPAAAQGNEVQGYLVNAAGSSVAQASSPSEATGPSGTDAAARLGWVRGAAAGAMAAGLFALGAFLESGEPRRRLARRVARARTPA